jgi:hypothetical protein
MTIGEMIRHGLHYGRTCRSLWVFGFIVALTSGGSSGGGGGGGGETSGFSVGAAGARATGTTLDGASAAMIVLLVAAVGRERAGHPVGHAGLLVGAGRDVAFRSVLRQTRGVRWPRS